VSNNSNAGVTDANSITAFSGDGYQLGSSGVFNTSSQTYVSWTFKQQPKFMDVVQFTTNIVIDPETGEPIAGGDATVSHNLQATPGFIMVKPFGSGNWYCYHRSLGTNNYIQLNSTAASGTGYFTAVSSTSLTVTALPVWGSAYECWLFAHNAGGFGLTGTDNVISCGSYVEATGQNLVNLGYEPQFLLIKKASDISDWWLIDTMRGMTVAGLDALFRANTSATELSSGGNWYPTATGFGNEEAAGDGSTWIYIAIRRGPMKVPTVGTSVFGLNARTGTGSSTTVTGSAGVSDATLVKNRGSAVADLISSRLTGTGYLVTSSTAAEVAAGTTILQANPWDVMDGVKVGTTSTITNASANTYINYLFERAPSVFDVVCYSGTGTTRTVNHNLTVVPELIIIKDRTDALDWTVYSATTGNAQELVLNSDTGAYASTKWGSTTPTSTVFTLATTAYETNGIGSNYIAYLFATCAGVSKVGSYTGTGTTLQIDCGFTSGARFILIKRTDSTGDWYYWDTARGIVAGNDSYLLLNSAAAQVTSTDYVDTYSAGFEISSTAPAAINGSGGSFIFLAIA
jgi:hypothetical protein